jgi:parvulin-like peptidyl-prolyl isomerase
VVQIKLKAIKALAARLAKREALATLVAEASEDEATKVTGGDLGIFSAARVPPEFVAQLEKLRVGQITAPFQTPLGFHIAQLTDVKPPRQLTYDEARAEIHQQLLNAKRAAAVASIAERLRVAEFTRTDTR